jgi:transglutaminase-like putative cysteine protease
MRETPPREVDVDARIQLAIFVLQDLPEETLVFLLVSRYCDTDWLCEVAWNLFGASPTRWARVQTICDFGHNHIAFGYQRARPTKTAWEAF